jgi:hypothetical protein
MEAFCFIGLLLCTVVIIGCTTILEQRINNLNRTINIDHDVNLNKHRDLYNDQKMLESRILKLEKSMNRNKSRKG